jgi:preprotein translocase subunit YajC
MTNVIPSPSAASAPTVSELHQASMISIFGMQVNAYALTIIIMLFIFLFLLFKAQRARRLDWMDMITRDGTKVSTTKILQLIGGVVGTWIIIKVTIQGVLTWDLFAIYLGYVASVDGFSKLIMAKYGAAGSDDSSVPYRRYGGYQPQQPIAPYQPQPPMAPQQPQQPDAFARQPDHTDAVQRGSAKAVDPDD